MAIWSGAPSAVRLTRDDLAAMLALQAVVATGLPAGFVRPKAERDLAGYLDGRLGAAYGILEGGALSAMAVVRIPCERHPNGEPRFRHVPEPDWPCHACFLESTMVLPAFRGLGYQRALIEARMAEAALAAMRWVCAGVRLENQKSWANLLAGGMVIADIRLDPGFPVIALLRPCPGRELSPDSADQLMVAALDHTQHEAALAAGYVGVRLLGADVVIYERLALPAA